MNKSIVEQLADNEMMVHDVYAHYAQIFPDLKEFWEHIAKEETGHYQMLMDLNKKAQEGLVHIDQNRFKTEAVEFVKKYLQEKIAEQNPGLDIALANAKNIENSLLEKDTFEIFETDSAELKNVLDHLRLETEEHLKEVTDKYDELYSGAAY